MTARETRDETLKRLSDANGYDAKANVLIEAALGAKLDNAPSSYAYQEAASQYIELIRATNR